MFDDLFKNLFGGDVIINASGGSSISQSGGTLKINGVIIPKEYVGGSIVNNVVISPNGKKYCAVAHDKSLKFGDVPKDGKITVDGTTITYRKSGGVHITGSGVSMSGIKTTGSIHIGSIQTGPHGVTIGDSDATGDVHATYDDVQSLYARQSMGNVILGLSDLTKVQIDGSSDVAPSLKNGRLTVTDLEGQILLPRMRENLTLDVRASMGTVQGDVVHAGTIRSDMGNISLQLYSPLQVKTRVDMGNAVVRGMTCTDDGIYVPASQQIYGVLDLRVSMGNINVTYHPSDQSAGDRLCPPKLSPESKAPPAPSKPTSPEKPKSKYPQWE